MDDTILQDALKLEERNWHNWLALAEKTRDDRIAALAAMSASKSSYLSGGRLKEDLKIIFSAIDEVVTKAVALRGTLAAHNLILAEARSLTPLKSKMADFINNGVNQMDDQASRTFPVLVPAARKEILGLARKEASTLRDRVTNDLENIPLELKLNPKKEERSPITVHVSGNSNNINLGTVLGDLNASVQTLSQSNHKDIADAIAKLGRAIQESVELNDATRRDFLEHLATVSEQVATPPNQRRIATFTNAISNLASIATVAMKAAPVYHEFIKLLTDNHILDQ